MTSTLAGADIRGFYSALGIELPEWATVEASVRCFADPDAHAHDDRDPSCSINLTHGAWHCWGCGAKGGAYDAALRSSGALARRWISWSRLGSPPLARRTLRARRASGGQPHSRPPSPVDRRPGPRRRRGCASTSRHVDALEARPVGMRSGRWRGCASSTVVCGAGRSLTSSISAGIAAG